MIGHGAFGRGANTSDASIAQLKKSAIETNVNKVYLGNSDTKDAVVDVLIGKDTLATLIENDSYSLQFVNKGLFLNSTTQLTSDNAVEVANTDAVSEYKFTKVVDYQILDFLSKKADQVGQQVNPSKLVRSSQSLAPRSQSYMTDIQEELEFHSIDSFYLDFDSSEVGIGNGDFLMIPDFQMNTIDSFSFEDNSEFTFDFWTESIEI
ncbi:MAG: hypothetical protein KC646_02400, partial [Candidatus Cloacimonetes bacterium]|nr:hypothetical protein [Candidatus Cloacimonadota bacterium]